MLYPKQVLRNGELQNAFLRAGMELIVDDIVTADQRNLT